MCPLAAMRCVLVSDDALAQFTSHAGQRREIERNDCGSFASVVGLSSEP
ncbi:MAG: hypothetical protein V5A21_06425 [Halapricum sp.]